MDPGRRIRWILAATVVVTAMAALWFLSLGGGPAGDGSPGAAEDAAGGEGPAVGWTRTVTVDSGPGRIGPWRMNRSDWRYVDDPTVALDGRGRAAVAWVDQERKDVLFQRFTGDATPTPGEPANVSRSPGIFSWLPRVAVSPDDPDRIYLLWQEIVFSGGTHGGEAFFARSTDGGRSFGEPLNLSETRAGAGKGRLTPDLWHNGSLDLALGPGGTIYAAWTVYEGGLFVARSTDRGESFSEPVRVTSGGGAEPARGPSLAVGSGGAVHLAWGVGGDPAPDLRYAVSRDTGRSFSQPRAVVPGPGHADAPKLAAGDDGVLHLAWSLAPEGGDAPWRVRYARAPAQGPPGAAPEFGDPVPVSGRPEGGVPAARFPHLALDAGGDPWVLWERYPGGRSRWPRGLAVASSSDGGRSFSSPALVEGTDDPAFTMNGSLQGMLMRKLAVGPSGSIGVVNSAFEPGEASRVRLYLGRTSR